jgi:hypothetical protein
MKSIHKSCLGALAAIAYVALGLLASTRFIGSLESELLDLEAVLKSGRHRISVKARQLYTVEALKGFSRELLRRLSTATTKFIGQQQSLSLEGSGLRSRRAIQFQLIGKDINATEDSKNHIAGSVSALNTCLA